MGRQRFWPTLAREPLKTEAAMKLGLVTLSALLLFGSATATPEEVQADVRSESTNELLDRRADINRRIRDDDFGAYIGITRWITHANQKDAALKERAAINAELERRHVSPRDIDARIEPRDAERDRERDRDRDDSDSRVSDRALLIGTWERDSMDVAGKTLKARSTFNSNGTFSEIGSIVLEGERLTYSASGTWRLDGTYIASTINRFSVPQLSPQGQGDLRNAFAAMTDKTTRLHIIRLTPDLLESEEMTTHIHSTAKKVNNPVGPKTAEVALAGNGIAVGTFDEFVSKLRKAVRTHNYNQLSAMMSRDFGWQLKPMREGKGAFEYWDRNNLWPELNRVIEQQFVRKGDYMVAPPEFVNSPSYSGFRAGIKSVQGKLVFAYFVRD